MTDFVYTHSHFSDTSEAIDFLYYNADDRRLVVDTTSGIFAGYEGVPQNVFDAMVVEDQNRDNGGSLGRYWNRFIKPYFTGFYTSWIDDFVEVDGVQEVSVSADPYSTEFEVTFSYTNPAGVSDVDSVTVFAGDQDEALVVFGQIADLAGYGEQLPDFRVSAVTTFFKE